MNNENIKVHNKRRCKNNIIMIIIPIIFIIIGFCIFFSSGNKNYKSETIGKLINTKEEEHYDSDDECYTIMYRGIYKYTVRDKEYEIESNISSSTRPKKEVKVYYNDDNPSEAYIESDKLFGLFFVGFGILFLIVFLIIFLIIFLFSSKKSSRPK